MYPASSVSRSPRHRGASRSPDRLRLPVRFLESAFFQLKVYGLLLHAHGRTPSTLRLLFLGNGGQVYDRPFSAADLAETEAQLQGVWAAMLAAFRDDEFPATAGRLCKWCAHRAGCPAFAAEPEAEPASE
jgi:putative RecB family exonuclease